jgi:branched-chain amino acid transport system substrate-binding protein
MRPTRRAFVSALALAAASGAALAQKPAPAALPILVGQSAGFTGGQAGYSADTRQGIDAAFEAANKAGGINGRMLKLVALDDQGKKDNVLVNTKTLVETEKVTALIGYTSGAGVEATLAYLDANNVPMLSPMTGNMGIRAAQHRNLFHTRAGYDDEMKKIVSHLALTGTKRFAICYLDDVGPANPKSMLDALELAKLKPVASIPLNRNATDFNAQVEELFKATPEAVIFISNGPPIVKIVQGMRAKGWGGHFATSSFSGLKVIDDLKDKGAGLIMSQVLPPPSKTHLRVIKEYQDDLKAFAPTAKPNYTSLEAYIAARVLVEGLRRGGAAGPEKLTAALEDIKRLDMGGYEISFSRKSHDGSRFVDTGVVSANGTLRF